MFELLLSAIVCLLPVGLLVGLVVWLTVRSSRSGSGSAQRITPSQQRDANLQQFHDYVAHWLTQGRLTAETAAQLQALIWQEREALRRSVAQAVPVAAAVPAAIAPPQAVATPALAAISNVAALPTTLLAATPTVDFALPLPPPPPPIASAAPTAGTPPRTGGVGAALVALRTRQLLLYLGAFLLVTSGLILVVFNWRNFSPTLQLGLLVSVSGGLWGAGAWMTRSEGLKQAGLGLMAVGGVLVPVVGFGLGRLLELPARDGWLLASALSLPVYALASWRLKQPLFVVAGCLSTISAALAVASYIDIAWQPAAALVVLMAALPLAGWLAQVEPALAAGPRRLAYIGVPLTLLYMLVLALNNSLGTGMLASTLWLGAAFYALASWQSRQARWLWFAGTIVPFALLATLYATNVDSYWWSPALALLALLYLGAALWAEPRALRFALPGYTGAALLALLAGQSTYLLQSERWTLPLLIVLAAVVAVASHRGRFGWPGLKDGPTIVGTVGVGFVPLLLPAWALSLLDLTPLNMGWQGVLLLPLVALTFAAAYWWPGRLRKAYDYALQAVGTLVAFGAAGLALSDENAWIAGAALFAAVWLFQSLLRRQAPWAALALGGLLLSAFAVLSQLRPAPSPEVLMVVTLLFTVAYSIGGTILRNGGWRYWTWPGVLWSVATGTLTVGLALTNALVNDAVEPLHAAAVLALAGLVALLAVLWQRPALGWLAAPLGALALLMAGSAGFFTNWQPSTPDYATLLCGVAVLGIALGQLVRRVRPAALAYAPPYEATGYLLLTLAPLPATESAPHATLTWLALAALYGLAVRLYALPWAAAPALLAADMALLRGTGWVAPGGRPAGGGLLLLAATWVQALLGLAAGMQNAKSRIANGAQSSSDATASPGVVFAWLSQFSILSSPLAQACYAAALISGAGALTLTATANDALAIAGVGLAALLALLATLHRSSTLAWGALPLLALGLAALHDYLGLNARWSLAWGTAEALALYLVGWAVALWRKGSIWQRPLSLGPLLASVLLTISLVGLAPITGDLTPLTFALATTGLLLATLALRERAPLYAYAAGGALVLAALCQLADWGFTQPQWYVLPAGIYLLALGDGIRRHSNVLPMARLVEAGGLLLMLGTTLGQSLRGEGIEWALYAAALCVESLLVLGYGTLRKLRVPFFGGVAFFVAAVLWLSVDPLQSANRWVLLGLLGLLMVGAYVLLERRQEQLLRAGRTFAERMASWG